MTTFLNIIVLIVNHDVILVLVVWKGAGSKSGGLGGVDTYFRAWTKIPDKWINYICFWDGLFKNVLIGW